MREHLHLCLLHQSHHLHVISDHLPEVGHLLQHLGEELDGVGMVDLKLELQRVQHCLLQLLNRLDVEQAWPIWATTREKVKRSSSSITTWEFFFIKAV